MIKPTFEETLKHEKSRIFPSDMSESTLIAIAHNDNVLFALEKQIPKKPKQYEACTSVEQAYICPLCGSIIFQSDGCFCSGCGQKLEWSKEE